MANRTESISGWRAKEYRTRQEIEHRKLSSRADDYNGGFRPGTSQAPFFTAPAHVSRGAVILSTPSPRPSPSLLLHAQVSHLAMPFPAFAADLIPNRLLKLPEAPILGITYFPSASKMFLCFSVTAQRPCVPTPARPTGLCGPSKALARPGCLCTRHAPLLSTGQGQKGWVSEAIPAWVETSRERCALSRGPFELAPSLLSRGDDSQPISLSSGLFKG